MTNTTRNMLVLFTTYAISWCVMALAFSATASVGHHLATDKSLALLPLIMQVFGAVMMTVPASKMMSAFGRRSGFMVGSSIGIVGALLCAYAVYQQNFWLLVCCTPFLGMFNGFGELTRFAAAELYADEDKKSRAIAIVVSGGIVSAFLGPAIAAESNQYYESIAPYFGPYLAAFVLCSMSLCCYCALRALPATQTKIKEEVIPVTSKSAVLGNPIFIVATSTAAIGYLVMSVMMDAMPITMLENDLDFSHTTLVLQWHLLAMFAPSYLTSKLIKKFGVYRIIYSGLALNTIGLLSAMQGVQLHHFWIGLFMIGLGWNLMYLGGTHLLTRIPAAIKSQAEGLNNLAIMSCFALAAPVTAFILATFGWAAVNIFALILLLMALITCLRFRLQLQRHPEPG